MEQDPERAKGRLRSQPVFSPSSSGQGQTVQNGQEPDSQENQEDDRPDKFQERGVPPVPDPK